MMNNLSKVETWITKSELSDDGWSQIKNFLFVKLTTTDGYEGWGEAFTLPTREKGVVQIIHDLITSLSNIDDLNPEIFHKEVKIIADGHRGIDFSAATSALEMSLWDIKGKQENKPLYKVLSNNSKKEIPVYATIWSDKYKNNEELSSRAIELLNQGYGGIKIYPLQNRTIEEAKICVSKIRDEIGPKTPLMLDLACPKDPNIALKFAPLIKEFNPYWYEEPFEGEATSMLKKIKNETGLKIVTGERQFGLYHYIETLIAEAVDIFNPDIAGVGGIIDFLKIAELSNKKEVKVTPHCWNSMSIAASAMLHVCKSSPNTEMAEFFPEYIPHALKFSNTNFTISNGIIELDDKPGLGIDINIESLMNIASNYKETLINKN